MVMGRRSSAGSQVDIGLAIVCGLAAFVLLCLPVAIRGSAAAAIRESMAAPLVVVQRRAELVRHAYVAHNAALRIIDSVSLRSQLLTGVEDENDRLRGLLQLASAIKWGFIPAEALNTRGVNDVFTIALSAGKSAGVDSLSPIVTTEGLVGMVVKAEDSQSLAIVWPHTDFRVSAMTADGSALGIVTSHHGEGASRYFLELHSVPLRSHLKEGTLVVSSGLGGVYPRGIPVGVVVAELKTVEGFAKTYLLRSVANLADINLVLILTPERVRAGLEGVWVTAARVR